LEETLSPWQVTGLTDGEGGFYCSILKTSSTNGTNRIRVKLEFKVVQKSHSEGVLFNFETYPCLTSKFLNFRD